MSVDGESLNLQVYASYAQGLGLQVFYGGIVERHEGTSAHWDPDNGDYRKFLRLAKDLGVKLVYMDQQALEQRELDSLIDEVEEVEDEQLRERLKPQLNAFRERVGETGSVLIEWLYDGVVHTYLSLASWQEELLELTERIEDLTGGEGGGDGE